MGFSVRRQSDPAGIPVSAASPLLNAEALEAELVKLPNTEEQLSNLIKIFSKVDKDAQLGPRIALLIAEMLTDSMATPFPGESPNIYLMRGAVMKSVTTFFSSKKLYNLYSKDRFSITEVLDKIKEGLLLEKSTNIPGRKISEETKKYIIALVDLYIEAVDNAKNDIEKQGTASAASPLIFSSLKVSLKGNLESVASQHALDLEEQFFRGINLSRRFNTNLENEEELNQWLGNAERWLRERIENSSGQFNAWNKDAVKEILNAQLDVIYRHEKHLFI